MTVLPSGSITVMGDAVVCTFTKLLLSRKLMWLLLLPESAFARQGKEVGDEDKAVHENEVFLAKDTGEISLSY